MGWLKDWSRRIEVQINHDVIDSDLENFPLLVQITRSSGRTKSDLSHIFNHLKTKENRKKIAITEADGITQCYVEIEEWHPSEKNAKLWVKVPKVNSKKNTILYLYYDILQKDNVSYVGDRQSAITKKVWGDTHRITRKDMPQIDLFFKQIAILNEIFPSNWFNITKNYQHPAYQRWKLCNTIIGQQGNIRYPEQRHELSNLGRLILDSYILVQISKGDLDKFLLGSLSKYGDLAVEKKILSRVTDQTHFESLMLELCIGAWNISQGNEVTPLEIEGYPDLKVEFSNTLIPAYIECKRIETKTLTRISDVIRKANNQIKRVKEDAFGFVVLDLSTPVSAGMVDDDTLPNTLSERLSVIKSALSGKKNRSIGAAIVVWDDYMKLGEPPEKTRIAFRRRMIRIDHNKPRTVVPRKMIIYNGNTVEYFLTWTPRFFPGNIFSSSNGKWDSSYPLSN